jgi:hypothetical protein
MSQPLAWQSALGLNAEKPLEHAGNWALQNEKDARQDPEDSGESTVKRTVLTEKKSCSARCSGARSEGPDGSREESD